MTIVIHFHQVHFRDFKTYYLVYVRDHLRGEFPHAVSYQRFVEVMPATVGPLCAYLQPCFGSCTGLSFVDSTALACATIAASNSIACFATLRSAAKRPWVGFMASNCIS